MIYVAMTFLYGVDREMGKVLARAKLGVTGVIFEVPHRTLEHAVGR
jgi:hypothetical protein